MFYFTVLFYMWCKRLYAAAALSQEDELLGTFQKTYSEIQHLFVCIEQLILPSLVRYIKIIKSFVALMICNHFPLIGSHKSKNTKLYKMFLNFATLLHVIHKKQSFCMYIFLIFITQKKEVCSERQRKTNCYIQKPRIIRKSIVPTYIQLGTL